MSATTKELPGAPFEERTKGLRWIYERGEPRAVALDLQVFRMLLERLDQLEERRLLSDPKVIKGLREAREDYLTGRLASHMGLIRELGLEGELQADMH